MRIPSSRNVVAATLCAFAFLVRGAEAAPNEARAAFAPIKIMTYNVQYCKYLPEGATSEVFDPAVTAARILAENPDFCCVNEVRDSAAHLEADALADATGLHKSFGGNESGSNGNLILSKEEPLGTETVFLKMSSAGWGDRYCLICEFTNFCVAVTHLDTHREGDVAEIHASNAVAIATIRAAFEKYTKPVFLCGDWNTRPNWENMARFNEFLDILSPTNGVRTYHGHSTDPNYGFILDYISVDKAHRGEFYLHRSYVVDDLITSDHNPVVAEFYRRPAASELGWVDESFLSTERTGAWSPSLAWDESTWTADLFGEKTFAPTTPSGGSPVTIDVTVAFDVIPDEIITPTEGTQASVGLGTNGCFQVWSLGGWADVAAEGVTPEVGVDYTFRFVFDYAAKTYSVALLDATGGTRLSRPLLTVATSATLPVGASSFPLAVSGSAVSAVAFKGLGMLTSIVGEYVVAEGFAEDEEIVLNNASVFLKAAQAAWLNSCGGGKVAVNNAAAGLLKDDFDKAYLLNLDITGENAYTFEVASVTVDQAASKVTIGVTLTRTGEIAQKINGTLKFYGAATLEAFTSESLEPLGDATLSDDDFSSGDTATAEIPLVGETPPAFFKAKIEEE